MMLLEKAKDNGMHMHEFVDRYPDLNKPSIFIALTGVKSVTGFVMNNVINGSLKEPKRAFIYHIKYKPNIQIGEIF